MVCDWGMSALGPLAFGKKEEAIFLGREIAQHRDYSEDTAIHIDQEVRRIVTAGTRTRAAFSKQPRHARANRAALLEREVLDATELKLLMENKPLPEKVRPTPPSPPQPAARRRTQASAAPGVASRPRLQQGLDL
jgi:cell division protease FtsH